MKRLLGLWLCLLAFLPGTAAAIDGVLFATAYHAIPSGTAIAVRPWDNSDDNLKLAREIADALRRAGYRVDNGAQVVLSFSTRDDIGSYSPGGSRPLVELEGTTGRGEDENARVRLNLYSSQTGGVLNRGSEATEVVPSNYQLEMTLDGRNGVRYWQGEASADLERTDGLSLTRAMVPALIEEIGRTVAPKNFEIP